MILTAAIFVVAVVALIWLARRADAAMRAACEAVAIDFEERLRIADEAEEKRRIAIYKQQKAATRACSQSDAAVRAMAADTSALRDEAIGLHQRMDRQLRGE